MITGLGERFLVGVVDEVRAAAAALVDEEACDDAGILARRSARGVGRSLIQVDREGGSRSGRSRRSGTGCLNRGCEVSNPSIQLGERLRGGVEGVGSVNGHCVIFLDFSRFF